MSHREVTLLDEPGLPQPSGGHKEYTDDQGQVTRVVKWFGYKLHLLVDVRHEVSLAYRISSTKAGDNEWLPKLVDQGQANLPRERISTLAYDKAADDGNVTGAARFHALVATVMILHEAFATVLASLPRHEGTRGKMRLSPITNALDEQVRGVARTPVQRRVRRTSASPRQPRLCH